MNLMYQILSLLFSYRYIYIHISKYANIAILYFTWIYVLITNKIYLTETYCLKIVMCTLFVNLSVRVTLQAL